VRDDPSFWECFGVTTDGTTSPEDFFPNDNFFPDIGNLFINDTSDNLDTNANANINPHVVPRVILSSLFQSLLEFLIVAI
jgi:hypothetical protein